VEWSGVEGVWGGGGGGGGWGGGGGGGGGVGGQEEEEEDERVLIHKNADDEQPEHRTDEQRDKFMREILSDLRGQGGQGRDDDASVGEFTSEGGFDQDLSLSFRAAKMVCVSRESGCA